MRLVEIVLDFSLQGDFAITHDDATISVAMCPTCDWSVIVDNLQAVATDDEHRQPGRYPERATRRSRREHDGDGAGAGPGATAQPIHDGRHRARHRVVSMFAPVEVHLRSIGATIVQVSADRGVIRHPDPSVSDARRDLPGPGQRKSPPRHGRLGFGTVAACSSTPSAADPVRPSCFSTGWG